LVDKLKGIYFKKNYKLISLDVVLLFINILMALTMDCNDSRIGLTFKKKCTSKNRISDCN